MRRVGLAFLLLAATHVAAADTRRDAVFILGEDTAGDSAYFEPASAYQAERMRADTDLLVTGARSLQDVREWLVRSHRDTDQPWGRIVLVAHGSPWIGLDVSLYSDGTRADLPDLERAVQRGEFPPLPQSVFDAQTRIVLESCGVGRRTDLLDLYAKLFGGANVDSHSILASENWIEYGLTSSANGHRKSWRSERLFEARIVPRASLDSDQSQALHETLSRQLSKDIGNGPAATTETWRTAPVHIELAITDPKACRSDRAIRQLSNHKTIKDALRAYGLQEKNLSWRVEQATKGCVLVGQGTLAVLGQGSLSGDLLP